MGQPSRLCHCVHTVCVSGPQTLPTQACLGACLQGLQLLLFCFSQKGEVLPAVCLECYLLGTFLWLFFVALHMPEQGVIDLKMPGLAVCLLHGATFSVRRRLAPVPLRSFLPPSSLPSFHLSSLPFSLFPASFFCWLAPAAHDPRVLNAPSALLIPGVSGGLGRGPGRRFSFACLPCYYFT